ncbi:uncharacterized protein LOC110455719 [Mizuhopecten yessoensis]|uniref:Uncharacterized protein n=1 Tax=Mizuhopecten yessoensis TaxID=6573 RepID=A0A210QCK3_MIZYE|nr:uncharacterized protein LOC110455719 [Mizuhopecten yessoensis]OWF46444.1 hypothetical protein KP79_PYT09709 [Mizuhopecten yessoensis]
MDDEQLRNIAQLLVKSVIEKAVDKINTETREINEGLDQGVDDIVGLTIGRSINAIRDCQSSPTDTKMEGLAGQFDKEVDDIVGLTIGRSIMAIRKGQSSPTDNKMEGMLGLHKTLVTATPEVTTGATGILILKDDKPTELKKAHLTTTHAQMNMASNKKNVLGRLLDRILKRDKKEVKEIDTATAGGSTNTSVGEKKKSASKAHNKRDWIRRNLLCCFVRQTATVEPLFE